MLNERISIGFLSEKSFLFVGEVDVRQENVLIRLLIVWLVCRLGILFFFFFFIVKVVQKQHDSSNSHMVHICLLDPVLPLCACRMDYKVLS